MQSVCWQSSKHFFDRPVSEFVELLQPCLTSLSLRVHGLSSLVFAFFYWFAVPLRCNTTVCIISHTLRKLARTEHYNCIQHRDQILLTSCPLHCNNPYRNKLDRWPKTQNVTCVTFLIGSTCWPKTPFVTCVTFLIGSTLWPKTPFATCVTFLIGSTCWPKKKIENGVTALKMAFF